MVQWEKELHHFKFLFLFYHAANHVRILGWGVLICRAPFLIHTHTHTQWVRVKSNCIVPLQPPLPLLVKQLLGLGSVVPQQEGRERGRDAAGVRQSAGASSIAERQGAASASGREGRRSGVLNRQLYSHCGPGFYLHFFTEPLNLRLKPFWMGIIHLSAYKTVFSFYSPPSL